MFSKLESVLKRYNELERLLSDPATASDRVKFVEYSKERAQLEEMVEKYIEYKKLSKEIEDNSELLKSCDEELRELAKEELDRLKELKPKMEEELKVLLIPKDPNDDKNIIIEIRSGTGGDEAATFAADLFRMYTRFAEKNGWKVEMMSSNPIGLGGYKEVIAMISGKKVYSKLKYEGGTHRVQRVPETEASGRIHTSAATVAILPEADDIELNINPADLMIDVYRAGGAGGQHVNTTDSAVRITHIPTGTVVTCQDERSQHKNKAKALTVLKARIFEKMQNDADSARASDRKQMVGSGDRSERIRTYNYPQGRITDHRIGLTLYKLEQFMEGEIDDMISGLITHYQAEALKHDQK
ncbi:MAG TPA: peptide chain release factor 1 [bacterium]|nr:peptide chain release factor 1 [bacterium]